MDATSEGSGSTPQSILLHVISPSLEVPDKLTYPNIAISTTVAELKRKIQDSIETKPLPTRQRLIYRGKALVQEDATLKDIFGPEAIAASGASDAFSLHLVLPPVPRASLNPAGMPQRSESNTPSLSPGVPLSPNGQLPHGMAPSRTASPSAAGAPHPTSFLNTPSQLPAPLQDLLNSHFSAMNTNTHPHLHPLFPPVIPSQLQQILTQQQQGRATAEQSGVNSTNAALFQQQHSMEEQSNRQNEGDSTGSNSAAEHNHNSTPHDAQNPNARHWRMVINQTTTSIPLPNDFGQHNNGFHLPRGPHSLNSQDVNFNPHQQTFVPHETVSTVNTRVPLMPSNALAAIHQRLSVLETMLDNGDAPTEGEIQQTRSLIQNVVQRTPGHFRMLAGPLQLRLNTITIRASQGRGRNIEQNLRNALSGGAQLASLPTVYLLSSPSGPQALLVSPSGTYATPGFTFSFTNHTGQMAGVDTSGAQQPNDGNLNAPFVPPGGLMFNEQAAGNLAQDPIQQILRGREQAQGQGQRQVQARDIIRILLPLGGNLWLLIRLLGLVYLFTGGWRRTLILGCGAIIAFLFQAGMLQPVQQALWAPFRRHIDGLLDFGGNNGDVAQAPGSDVRDATATLNQHTPEQMADRLVRERQNQNGGFVRVNVRRLERAVALFIASLVPGVSERHIAARDAAHTAIQAQQTERENQMRREEDESRQRLEGEAAEGTGEGLTEPAGHTNEAQREEQPPLVEI